MKETLLLFSAIILFAGLTFGQTPQTQEKATTTTTKAQTTTVAPAKDAKAGCDKKDMEKCAKSKDAKSSCCPSSKKAATDTKAPEKK